MLIKMWVYACDWWVFFSFVFKFSTSWGKKTSLLPKSSSSVIWDGEHHFSHRVSDPQFFSILLEDNPLQLVFFSSVFCVLSYIQLLSINSDHFLGFFCKKNKKQPHLRVKLFFLETMSVGYCTLFPLCHNMQADKKTCISSVDHLQETVNKFQLAFSPSLEFCICCV